MQPAAAYLIVGASGAIGSAVATQLAKPGVRLGLHYNTRPHTAADLKARLEQAGAICECLQSDLSTDDACRSLVARFHASIASIDGVALCGGTIAWRPWRELDVALWQKMLYEHCIAPFTIAEAAARSMSSRGQGRVVFLSSIASKYGGSATTLHYAAAKGALEVAMRGLARQVVRSGVSVNGVRAGFVDTPLHRNGRSAEEIRERIRLIPAARAGTPEEVASAVVYLLSESASFISGELITVAGGD